MHLFTLCQGIGLAILWIVKSTQAALVFPFFVVFMVPLRLALKFIFTPRELDAVSPPRPWPWPPRPLSSPIAELNHDQAQLQGLFQLQFTSYPVVEFKELFITWVPGTSATAHLTINSTSKSSLWNNVQVHCKTNLNRYLARKKSSISSRIWTQNLPVLCHCLGSYSYRIKNYIGQIWLPSL